MTFLFGKLRCTLICILDIVERDKKAVQKFEFDPLQEDAFDICNKTWKMINQ